MKKISKNVGMYIVLIVLVVSLVNVFLGPDSNQKSSQTNVMPYSAMLNEVNNGNVARVRIDHEQLTGTLKSGGEFKTFILDASTLPSILAATDAPAHRRLDLLHLQHAGRRQQGHGLREEQGEAFPRQPPEGDLRRRRRLRRIEGRA